MNTKSETFSIRITTKTLDHFKALAESEDRSVNYVINRVLDEAAQPKETKT